MHVDVHGDVGVTTEHGRCDLPYMWKLWSAESVCHVGVSVMFSTFVGAEHGTHGCLACRRLLSEQC